MTAGKLNTALAISIFVSTCTYVQSQRLGLLVMAHQHMHAPALSPPAAAPDLACPFYSRVLHMQRERGVEKCCFATSCAGSCDAQGGEQRA